VKILVIGGAGYLGSVLCPILKNRGHQVTIVDRLMFMERISFVDVSIKYDLKGFYMNDMREIPDKVFEGQEVVINIGGLSNDPCAEFNPRANVSLNTTAAWITATQAKQAGAKKYLYASTCSIYQSKQPQDIDLASDEHSEVDPQYDYAKSKLHGENRVMQLNEPGVFEVFCLRKGTLSGWSPRMRFDLVVNTMVKDAMSKGFISVHGYGQVWRPICHVEDAAMAYVCLAESVVDLHYPQVFNVVTENYKISDLAFLVMKALHINDVKCVLRGEKARGPMRSYRVDAGRLMFMGWEPKRNILYMVDEIVSKIAYNGIKDFDNPIYYNIKWLELHPDLLQLPSKEPAHPVPSSAS